MLVLVDSELLEINVEFVKLSQSTTDITRDVTVFKVTLSAQASVFLKQDHQDQSQNFPLLQDLVKTSMPS